MSYPEFVFPRITITVMDKTFGISAGPELDDEKATVDPNARIFRGFVRLDNLQWGRLLHDTAISNPSPWFGREALMCTAGTLLELCYHTTQIHTYIPLWHYEQTTQELEGQAVELLTLVMTKADGP